MTELALIARATAILVACFGILGLFRRTAAALRALILTLTFAALLLLPAAAAVLPAMRVANPVPSASVAVPHVLARVAPAPIAVTIVARATAPARPGAVLLSTASIVLLVWVVGAASFATQLIVSVWRTSRARRGFTCWPRGHTIAQSILDGRSRVRSVSVVLDESVHAPFAFGLRHATIVFPSDATGWRDDDVRRALVHELEHVRRGDWIVLLGSRLVCALYWFHPLAWLLARRASIERELACDDRVLASGADAREYAEHLLDVARTLRPASRTAMVAVSTLVNAMRDASFICRLQRSVGGKREGGAAG